MSDRAAPEDGPRRCDFCRLPIPETPVEATIDGVGYAFCSQACHDRLTESEYVFSEYHGHRRFRTGVVGADAALPQGMPRNAFVLMSGQAGTREAEIQAEFVWRTLQRGEPAVVVSYQEPPGSLVQQFLTLEWNVLPYLERGQLAVLDCFTYRVDDPDRMFDRMDEWNTHLYDVAEAATTTCRDPTDLGEVENKLDNVLEGADMVDEGLVLIDSLTELGTLVQPVQAYNFVKDLRADVCKGRFVPVIAGATIGGDAEAFPHDLDYVVDGLVDLRLNEEIVANTLIKEIRVRKCSGVLAIPEWSPYEYTSETGMVLFDPEEEMADSEADGEADAAASGDGDADGESDGGEPGPGATDAE